MTVKAILSDLHCHKWSRFSTLDSKGVSSRLTIILNEMKRAAKELIDAGGKDMVLAGDLFHVRGSIEPSVFNPTHECVEEILGMGIDIWAIPGNHDLEGKDTSSIGNAMQTFGAMDGFTVITEPSLVKEIDAVMVPWVASIDDLKSCLDSLKIDHYDDRDILDVIIHAGIDGVLPGLPDHGLDGEDLANLGFRRVFAGHYHNHKEVYPGVVSIGATTQQTFSDIGAKAGFLLVDDNDYKYRASHAPQFVELNEDTDPNDIPLIADGNYVRVSGMELDDKEINQIRDNLNDLGAKGTSFMVARKTEATRTNSTQAKGMTLAQSVSAFVENLKSPFEKEVQSRCSAILTRVEAVSE